MANDELTPLDLVRKELPTIEKILGLGARPGTDLSQVAANEFMYLEQIFQLKPDLRNCTPLSILLAVKGVMQKNLSLDPQAGLVYVKTRSVNVGTDSQKKWVKVAEIMPSPNGLISIARQNGRILDFTNPKVTKNAKGMVVGVSMKILKPSYEKPRWEEYEYDESDFMRWKRASHNENARYPKDGKPVDAAALNYANPNYTNFYGGIDPEFARAKCIRHSLKKLGTNAQEAPVRVYDVPAQRVVDPEIDVEDGPIQDEYITHEEVSSQPISPTLNLSGFEFPNSDEL